MILQFWAGVILGIVLLLAWGLNHASHHDDARSVQAPPAAPSVPRATSAASPLSAIIPD